MKEPRGRSRVSTASSIIERRPLSIEGAPVQYLKALGDGLSRIRICPSHTRSGRRATPLTGQPCQTRSIVSGRRRARAVSCTPFAIDIIQPATAEARMASGLRKEMAMAITDRGGRRLGHRGRMALRLCVGRLARILIGSQHHSWLV
jgi:hypothetical protein